MMMEHGRTRLSVPGEHGDVCDRLNLTRIPSVRGLRNLNCESEDGLKVSDGRERL